MARRSNSVESFDEDEYEVVVVEDLSSWEIIDLKKNDTVFSVSESSDSLITVENTADDVISESKAEEELDSRSLHEIMLVQSILKELGPNHQIKGLGEYGGGRDADTLTDLSVQLNQNFNYTVARDFEYDNYDDDDDDCEQGYEDEYDDELVPFNVRDRFGKQRIRKMAKRICPTKMKTSKKLPNKCQKLRYVRGKHGLGVQFAYI